MENSKTKLPIPDFVIGDIYELTAELLKEKGISLLLLDLDNTLSPYGSEKPTPRLRRWIRDLQNAGIEPFILSNNRGSRPEYFANLLGIGYMGKAGKPFAKKLTRLLEDRKVCPENAALAGDQIYTDILCAKNAGIQGIAVQPISLGNPFRAVRYALESPFRAAYQIRRFRDE